MMPSISLDLEIVAQDEHFRVEWGASYGASGIITARRVQISLEPGKPR